MPMPSDVPSDPYSVVRETRKRSRKDLDPSNQVIKVCRLLGAMAPALYGRDEDHAGGADSSKVTSIVCRSAGQLNRRHAAAHGCVSNCGQNTRIELFRFVPSKLLDADSAECLGSARLSHGELRPIQDRRVRMPDIHGEFHPAGNCVRASRFHIQLPNSHSEVIRDLNGTAIHGVDEAHRCNECISSLGPRCGGRMSRLAGHFDPQPNEALDALDDADRRVLLFEDTPLFDVSFDISSRLRWLLDIKSKTHRAFVDCCTDCDSGRVRRRPDLVHVDDSGVGCRSHCGRRKADALLIGPHSQTKSADF